MSFLIEYCQGHLQRFIQNSRETPSPIYYLKENTVISGDFFDTTAEEIASLNWQDNPEVLNDIEGNVAVLSAEEQRCAFAVDMNGFDSFYYYHKDGRLLISDYFWDIVKEIQPTIEDVNIEAVKFLLYEGGTVNGDTIIKNLKHMMPNQIVSYDAKNDELAIKQYRVFKYNNACDDVDVAVEHMDAILKSSMRKIKEKCGNVKYGIGISGGLDSRIIAHYALAEGMDVVGFNICIPKPRKWLDAMSVKNAKCIANAFGIKFHPVSWGKEHVIEKVLFSIKKDPSFMGNSFKYETSQLPTFDVLLTGGSGLVVGSMLPEGLAEFTKQQLVDSIYNLFANYDGPTFSSRARRALKYLFGVSIPAKPQRENFWAKVIVGKDYQKEIRRDIELFVQLRSDYGLSNIEIFEDYFLNIGGYNNRFGSFESLFSTKRAFSIYVPFMLKETLSWTPNLLYKRAALNRLIEKKVPEVAEYKTESFAVAPNGKKSSLLKKIFTMIEFLFRGNGTAIDEYYMKKDCVIETFIKFMNRNMNDWFHQIFKIEGMKIDEKIVRNEPVRLTVRVWELKALIDCLENKDYLHY